MEGQIYGFIEYEANQVNIGSTSISLIPEGTDVSYSEKHFLGAAFGLTASQTTLGEVQLKDPKDIDNSPCSWAMATDRIRDYHVAKLDGKGTVSMTRLVDGVMKTFNSGEGKVSLSTKYPSLFFFDDGCIKEVHCKGV